MTQNVTAWYKFFKLNRLFYLDQKHAIMRNLARPYPQKLLFNIFSYLVAYLSSYHEKAINALYELA